MFIHSTCRTTAGIFRRRIFSSIISRLTIIIIILILDNILIYVIFNPRCDDIILILDNIIIIIFNLDTIIIIILDNIIIINFILDNIIINLIQDILISA